MAQGAEAKRARKRSREDQEKAQRKAEVQTQSTQRKERERVNDARRRTPDAETILSNVQAQGAAGNNSLLSGLGGVDPGSLRLSRNTLLGE